MRALVILDAQNICPTVPRHEPGLAIGHGDDPALSGREVAEPLLSLAQAVKNARGRVIAVRDATDDRSPSLCIRGTDGAAWNPRLRLPKRALVVRPTDGGTSLLDRRTAGGDSLRDLLAGVDQVWIGGLTTADGFRAAVHDLREAGHEVEVLADAVFALDAGPGEKPRMAGFAAEGARIISTGEAILRLHGWQGEYPAPRAEPAAGGPPARDTWTTTDRPADWRRFLPRLRRRHGERLPQRGNRE